MSVKNMTWVFEHSPYRGDMRVTHLAIADVANDDYDNRVWLSQSKLAEKVKCGRQAINRHLREMVSDGYLEVLSEEAVGATKSVKVYRLLLPEAVAEDDTFDREAVALDDPKLSPSRPQAVALAKPSPHINSTNPTENTKTSLLVLSSDGMVVQGKAAAVREVFDLWKLATKRTDRTALDSRRRGVIERALRDYPLADVIAAIRGVRRSAYHQGQNDEAKVYDDLTLILRDAKHIEEFRDLEWDRRRNTAPPGPAKRTTAWHNMKTALGWPDEQIDKLMRGER